MDSVIKSNNIDDDAPWLNIVLLTPPTHEGACLVGAKELSTKELAIVNELIWKKKWKTRLIVLMCSLSVCKAFWWLKYKVTPFEM